MADHTLFGTAAPGTLTRNDGQYYSLGTEFYVTAPAWLTTIRFYKPDTTSQTVTCQVYLVNADGTAGTAMITAATITSGTAAAGWKTHTLPAPIGLVIGERYRVVNRAQYFRQTDPYWANSGPGASGITAGPLSAPNVANARGNAQSSWATGTAVTFPFNAGSTTGQCWFSDVVVTDIDPTGRSQTQFLPYLP